MSDYPYPEFEKVEAAIADEGPRLWQEVRKQTPGIFDRQYWQGMLMDLVMRDPEFKKDLFQFVDVLPSLKKDRRIADYIKSYLVREGRDLPRILNLSFKLLSNRLTAPLAAKGLKKKITQLAENFILGKDIQNALIGLRANHDKKIGFTADILGEKTNSDAEADIYQNRYLELIDVLSAETTNWPQHEILTRDHLGAIPLANVSVKISALDSQISPVDLAGSVARLKERVLPIMLRAKAKNVFVNFDLEQWEYHFITYHLLEEIVAHPELKHWPHVGMVVQGYLKNAHRDLDFLASLAAGRGAPITVRLVKGAYWDYEVIKARQTGIDPPVLFEKRQTDANYEKLSYELLKQHIHLKPAFGSHNVRSLLAAVNIAKALKVPPKALEVQMLVGMAEPIREALLTKGHRIRLYSPIGALLPGIAYLVRRLLENSSNSGFLSQGFVEERDISELLHSPHRGSTPVAADAQEERGLKKFANAALLDFVLPETGKRFQQAVDRLHRQLPIDVPVVINGNEIKDLPVRERFSPNDKNLLVVKTAQAGMKEATKAVSIARAAWPQWRDLEVAQRAQLLETLADNLEKDRHTLAALQTLESAKPWSEADGDVAEAIDFCRYYAHCAEIELAPHPQGEAPGEVNMLSYVGRGPTVVIAPWNFPLAILCGMTSAALVAGNTVILKPSNNSTAIAYSFYNKLIESGFSEEVVQFLPGPGTEVGNYLVEHPQIVQIAFTGSREVGLEIIEKAGTTLQEQPQVKKVVCEMGGKNANIIDEDADFDQAVPLVVKGAFGYAGQKCSATSRVIVLKGIYEAFIERLVAAVDSMLIAPADQPGCRLGPVIDQQAYERLHGVIDHLGPEVKVHYRGNIENLHGLFVPPVLIEVNDPQHPLFRDELFGPILTLIVAEDFDHALALANDSQFALTGSLFSRNRDNIARAKKQFMVGNLYINRESTGAVVGRQPFGGFKMSGIGNKAGGPNYVRLFADARCVTENTMRKGFSPDIYI